MTASVPRVELSGHTLSVSGVVDAQSVLSLRSQGEKLIQSVKAPVEADLAGLETANSVVLSMLLCWQRIAEHSGSTLSFKNASDRLASLAALSNLDEQLPGFETV